MVFGFVTAVVLDASCGESEPVHEIATAPVAIPLQTSTTTATPTPYTTHTGNLHRIRA